MDGLRLWISHLQVRAFLFVIVPYHVFLIFSPACENGECIAPDVCQCNSMFVGASCNVNLIAVVLPVVISVLVLVVVSALIGRWYFKKYRHRVFLAVCRRQIFCCCCVECNFKRRLPISTGESISKTFSWNRAAWERAACCSTRWPR